MWQIDTQSGQAARRELRLDVAQGEQLAVLGSDHRHPTMAAARIMSS